MKRMKNEALGPTVLFLSILLLCIALVPASSPARQLSEHEVQAAVETWVRQVTADARPDAVIQRMEPHRVRGETVAYIAHLHGGGFCLCGNDDLLLPVYYYCPQGEYDPNSVRYWGILHQISAALQKFRSMISEGDPEFEKYRPSLEPLSPYWQQLIAGVVPQRQRPKGLWEGPDSMSLGAPDWNNHQGWPFNAYCPYIVNPTPSCTLRTVDGCVAHSMSIILRYWQWPPSGEGQDQTVYDRRTASAWMSEPLSFYPFKSGFDSTACSWRDRLRWVSTSGGRLQMKGDWDRSCIDQARRQVDMSLDTTAYWNAVENLWDGLTLVPDTLTANFATATYRYDLMPHSRWDVDMPDEIDAVSTLTHHVGIACHMGYGVFGSSAYAQPEPYISHFRYDPDASSATLGHCNEPDTCEGAKTMVDEIQWLRVVNYHYGYPLGHAWIIHGYNRLFLPDSMQFRDDNGWQTFHPAVTVHPVVYRIAPKDIVKFVGAANPGDGTPDDPYANIEEAIAEAPDGATLIFKAGSDNTFSAAPLTITRPLTMRGRDVVIRKQ